MDGILESAYQGKLLKKWKDLIESGPQIKDEYTQIALAQVLESTYQDFKRKGLITEADFAGTGMGTSVLPAQDGSNGVLGPGDYNWPTIVMPMLRRIFPTLMAHELVGVQPMNGPIGYAMALRAVYGKDGIAGEGTLDSAEGTEIGYNNILTQFTGAARKYNTDKASGAELTAVAAADTVSGYVPDFAGNKNAIEANLSANAFNPNRYADGAASASITTADKAWNAYAGATTTLRDYLGVAQATGTAEWADLGSTYPTVKFNLIKKPVDARTRKLAANWSPELAEDMAAMHGINVEEEMMNILSYEIGAEIDRQIITEMVAAAILGGQVSEWSAKAADGNDQLQRIATLLTTITVEAQQIAIRSRRGNANFVVASPKVTGVLQQLTANKFVSLADGASMPTLPKPGIGALTKVGLINDGQQLLVRDTFAQGDYALLGFKGTTPGDSGIIYCPYIPIQLQKIPALTGTFTPAVGARTRYGMMSTPWDAKNYYHMITIDLGGGYSLTDSSRVFLQ